MAGDLGHILLIQPRSKKFYSRSFETGEMNSHPPVGLLSLAGVLKWHGYRVRVLDLLVEKVTRDRFRQILHEFRPGVVGITVLTETCRAAETIASEVREEIDDCRIVFGGVFPSFEYESLLRNEAVDFVIRFEGEGSFLELLEYLRRPDLVPLEGVPGLAYRKNGAACENLVRRPPRRLDAQPFMDREVITLSSYTHKGTINAGRGCGYHCIFCSSAQMFGSAPRIRSAENLFAEVYYLYRNAGLRDFYFVDQSFTSSRERTRRFCHYVVEAGMEIRWRCLSHVNTISRDLLESMKAAGCREIEYGIESGDPAVLETLGKGITLEKAVEVIKLSRAAEIEVVCFFMVGHPADTLDSMKRTIEFARRLKDRYEVEIIARMNTPFPGTYQYEHADELGMTIHARDWDDYSYTEAIGSTGAFTRDQLRAVYFDFMKRIEEG